MSPLSLRRYRAERMLREDFEGVRAKVTATVRGRLRAQGVRLDESDLDACYAMAWHGLYAAVLEGQEIANTCGWLTLVTYRRAIEEQRVHGRLARGGEAGTADAAPAAERDFDAELDDRVRLRHLFEALRGRLSPREQEAAALCYLQGLSRSEAAARMGVSEPRMRKLMEGRGRGSPGVAGKVGVLIETIRSDGWCEEQGSLMRGFAYGILDPDGERYRLARLHHGECPACRSYVLSLRGLAAVLPPVPSLLHLALSGSVAANGAGTARIGGAGSGAHSAAASTGAAVPAGSAAALTASAGAGAGAAGGSWLLAGGPLGAKLAVGCLLALGVGAGCAVLSEHPARVRSYVHGRRPAHPTDHARDSAYGPGVVRAAAAAAASGQARVLGARSRASAETNTTPASSAAGEASREFGPESASTVAGAHRVARPVAAIAPAARAASVSTSSQRSSGPTAAGTSGSGGSAPATAGPASQPAAQREFAPG